MNGQDFQTENTGPSHQITKIRDRPARSDGGRKNPVRQVPVFDQQFISSVHITLV